MNMTTESMAAPGRRAAGIARAGFTLIELLIAAAIGSVILVGAVQLMRSNRIAYSIVQQMKTMEENGRVAMDMMSHDMKATTSLWSLDNASSTYATTQAALNAKPGTDIVEIFASLLSEPIRIDPSAFNDAAANVQVPKSGLVGLPGYYTTMPNASISAALQPYNVLIYDCNSTSHACSQDITGGQFNGSFEVRINYNRGNKCSDNAVYGMEPALEFPTMFADMLSPDGAFAAPPSGGAGAGGGGGGGGGGAGGTDCGNRPHDCSNVITASTTKVCVNIGWDVYYYVENSDAANPRLVRYVVNSGTVGKKEVIANHVEDFQMLYAEDDDDTHSVSTSEWENDISDATKVRALRTSILIKSPTVDSNKGFATAPTLENSSISSVSDQFRRRVFSRTIRLRNMGD